MASIREMRGRIKSVKNTQQITKAMKMVSVSKLRKNQFTNENVNAFEASISSIMSALVNSDTNFDNEYINKHESNTHATYVIFTGSRGLCGVYNNAIVNFGLDLINKDDREIDVVVCGKMGTEIINESGYHISRVFKEFTDTPKFEEIKQLSLYLMNLYRSGETDEIILVYQAYASVMSQKPTEIVLLPIESIDLNVSPKSIEYEFAPDKSSVIDNVIDIYIHLVLFKTMSEAKCAEHAARMTAMTAASDNTEDLIDELSQNLNRARQAAVTTEISEIVGGASALKTNGGNV